jgi:hypothetical protein
MRRRKGERRRDELGKGKEGRLGEACLGCDFYFPFIFLAYCGGKRKLLVFFHLGPFLAWFYEITSFLMVVTSVGGLEPII